MAPPPEIHPNPRTTEKSMKNFAIARTPSAHDAPISIGQIPLIVPGLRDHVPEHWQTLLEQKLPNAISVPRRDHDKLSCATWVEDLDRFLARIEGAVVLVAHSAGVAIVMHWA